MTNTAVDKMYGFTDFTSDTASFILNLAIAVKETDKGDVVKKCSETDHGFIGE